MTWTVAVGTIAACVVCVLVTRQVVLARVERSEQQKKDERLQWSRWMWHKLERTLKELDLAAVWGPNFSILVPEAQIQVDASRGMFEVWILEPDGRGRPIWKYGRGFPFGAGGGNDAGDHVLAIARDRLARRQATA